MAENTIKVVSYANLQSYDKLIKKFLGDADSAVNARSIKTILWDSTTEEIKFFKKENATLEDTADYKVKVASSDVATLKEEMTEVQGTLAGYSSTSTVASAISAAKTEVEGKVTALENGAVKDNANAIDAINNSTTGILAQAKAYTDALENGQVSTNASDIAAINDETTGILANSKAYTNQEVKKVTDSIGTVEEGETVVSMIADAKKAGTDADAHLATYKTSNDAAVAAAKKAGDDAQADVDALEGVVGDMTAVKTTAKTVAGAVDELKDAIDSATKAGEVELTTAETATEGYLKTYVLSQGGEEVGKIDIPKDLVVKSGEVVVDPEGQPKGTYIKLVIANDEETPIYIDVKNLVDIYKGAESATQVQITVDGYTISASLVAGGVGTTELADSAVTTAKVADKNITKDKLSESVQATLDKADAAEQAIEDAINALDYTVAPTADQDYVASITEEDGIIAPVYGKFNFDEKGAAATAEANAKQYADDLYEIASSTDIDLLFQDVE